MYDEFVLYLLKEVLFNLWISFKLKQSCHKMRTEFPVFNSPDVFHNAYLSRQISKFRGSKVYLDTALRIRLWGWWDGSAGRDIDCQAWGSEFDPWDLHSGRGDLTPESCPLTSPPHIHGSPHITHRYAQQKDGSAVKSLCFYRGLSSCPSTPVRQGSQLHIYAIQHPLLVSMDSELMCTNPHRDIKNKSKFYQSKVLHGGRGR